MQLDFQMPIRFNLSYATDAGSERPVIVHRAVLGSVERMYAILTEHYAGKWPLWLSPRQVMVLPISEKVAAYASEVRAAAAAASQAAPLWGASLRGGEGCFRSAFVFRRALCRALHI